MGYTLTKNENGMYVLTVAYDRGLRNWTTQIDRAVRQAGLENEKRLTIIAMPEGLIL